MTRPRTAGYIYKTTAEDRAAKKYGNGKRGEIRNMLAEASSAWEVERVAPGTGRSIRDAIGVIASAVREKQLMLGDFSSTHVVEPLLYYDKEKLLREMRRDPWLRSFCNRVNVVEDELYEKALAQYAASHPGMSVSSAYYAIRVITMHVASASAAKR